MRCSMLKHHSQIQFERIPVFVLMHFRCCANHDFPDTQRTEFGPLITEKTKETEIAFLFSRSPPVFLIPETCAHGARV